MKFTLTGSLGNITRPMAELLVQAGHQVTVISSKEDKKEEIESLGAKAVIGSMEDAGFLAGAFKGADGIYTMVPPNFNVSDYRAYIAGIGRNFAQAIRESGVTRVVNLSSVGAHLDGGTGPIAGLHDVEHILNGLEGVAVKHLRAAFFYVNFLGNIDMIRHMGIIGGNYGPNTSLVLVHPTDIAAAAAQEFQQGFSGKSYRYIASDERRLEEVASVLGKAIGKPDLQWVEFTDEQAFDGMKQAGLSDPIANTYIEMGSAMRKGLLFEDYLKNKPPYAGKVKLEDFAVEFQGKY